ncbi:MAG: hypothetical protein NTV51_23890 [Verrucomicrobia bacterium]|nr:hypothetical protein [Verrucomicrobiota bacterium]
MKTLVAGWLALVIAAAAGAQTATAPTTKTDPKDAKKAVPAAPTKKDEKKKKEEPPGKIDGMAIPRGTGFIGIQIVNGVFKLTAYDAKKKPVAADFTRVALRWTPSYQKAPERALLTPGTGVGVFTAEKNVRPPHSFRLFITLIKGDTDDAPVENFTVDFRADGAAPDATAK